MTEPITYERDLKGPDSYEHFNTISKVCQARYLRLISWQIYMLSLIALISTVPELKAPEELVKLIVLLALIIIVLGLMIMQFRQNYMEGWQKARFLAESILSECWLFVFQYADYNEHSYEDAIKIFHSKIKGMKSEVDIRNYLCIAEAPHKDHDNPEWMQVQFAATVTDKKDFYIRKRVENQISWYEKKQPIIQQTTIHFLHSVLGVWWQESYSQFLLLVKQYQTLPILGCLPRWLQASFLGSKQRDLRN